MIAIITIFGVFMNGASILQTEKESTISQLKFNDDTSDQDSDIPLDSFTDIDNRLNALQKFLKEAKGDAISK